MNKQEIFATISAKEIEFLDSLSHQDGGRITRASLAGALCVHISDQALVFESEDGSKKIITLGLMGKNYPTRAYVSESLPKDLHSYYLDLCEFSKEDLQLAQDTEQDYYIFRYSEKEKEKRRQQYESLKQEFESA
jgi:hypothetical protein